MGRGILRMERRENQRIKLTRKLLKNSLIELMHSKSINKITIKEICERAELNRSTFYLYYSDQYALLNEIEGELLEQAQSHLQKIASRYDSMQYLETLLIYIKENADIFQTLLCHQESLHFQSAFVKTSFQNLKQNLPLDCSEQVRDYVYYYLIMGCLSIIKKWIDADFDMPSGELTHLIFQLSAKAVSAVS